MVCILEIFKFSTLNLHSSNWLVSYFPKQSHKKVVCFPRLRNRFSDSQSYCFFFYFKVCHELDFEVYEKRWSHVFRKELFGCLIFSESKIVCQGLFFSSAITESITASLLGKRECYTREVISIFGFTDLLVT